VGRWGKGCGFIEDGGHFRGEGALPFLRGERFTGCGKIQVGGHNVNSGGGKILQKKRKGGGGWVFIHVDNSQGGWAHYTKKNKNTGSACPKRETDGPSVLYQNGGPVFEVFRAACGKDRVPVGPGGIVFPGGPTHWALGFQLPPRKQKKRLSGQTKCAGLPRLRKKERLPFSVREKLSKGGSFHLRRGHAQGRLTRWGKVWEGKHYFSHGPKQVVLFFTQMGHDGGGTEWRGAYTPKTQFWGGLSGQRRS